MALNGSALVDRISGALLLAIAVGAIWHAQSLTVPFAADPLGPKAFPTLAGAILALAGAALLLRPEKVEMELGDWTKVVLVALACLAYPLLLAPLGFVPATTLLCFATALAFKGPRLGSLISAVALSVAFLVIIDMLLGLPLPRGPLGV